MFVLRSKVKVEDVSAATPRFGLWDGALPAGSFRLGEARALVFGPAPEGRPATLDEWALSLIRDGVVQVVPGTQEAFVPQMANYELVGGVSFKKGCYPGQEIVARTQYRGILKKRAVRVHSATPLAAGRQRLQRRLRRPVRGHGGQRRAFARKAASRRWWSRSSRRSPGPTCATAPSPGRPSTLQPLPYAF